MTTSMITVSISPQTAMTLSSVLHGICSTSFPSTIWPAMADSDATNCTRQNMKPYLIGANQRPPTKPAPTKPNEPPTAINT